MASGLRKGDGGAHLITFHPTGQYSSAIWFHDAPWLDFNMVQTGHTRDRDNYTSVAAEYNRTPVKPVLDGEPGDENIPHGFEAANGRLEAIHARRFCYWALFSGAFGHTYGCNEVWQMWQPGRQPMVGAQFPWNEAIRLPAAGQMRHARTLIESGPYFDRMPDPSLVAPPNASGSDYVAACRAPDARYALAYFPSGHPATLRTYLLRGPRVSAQWFDPRTGERHDLPPVEVAPWKTTEFKPPVADQDWVLVLGDAASTGRAQVETPPDALPVQLTVPLPGGRPGVERLEFVLIRAGSFVMGCPVDERGRVGREWPPHRVTISRPFHLGRHEVTQGQWEAVMGSNPAKPPGVGLNYPVHDLTWNDCQAFLARLNALGCGTFRLPTEAEWE